MGRKPKQELYFYYNKSFPHSLSKAGSEGKNAEMFKTAIKISYKVYTQKNGNQVLKQELVQQRSLHYSQQAKARNHSRVQRQVNG